MTYATQQDLIDRYGEEEIVQLTDRADPPQGAIDATAVTRALEDASHEIDGYLAARYTLPLTTTPQVLVRLACDIARYRLYDDRATEAVTQRYRDAVRFLEAIARGQVNLGLDASAQAPATSGGPDFSAPDRVFSAETLADY